MTINLEITIIFIVLVACSVSAGSFMFANNRGDSQSQRPFSGSTALNTDIFFFLAPFVLIALALSLFVWAVLILLDFIPNPGAPVFLLIIFLVVALALIPYIVWQRSKIEKQREQILFLRDTPALVDKSMQPILEIFRNKTAENVNATMVQTDSKSISRNVPDVYIKLRVRLYATGINKMQNSSIEKPDTGRRSRFYERFRQHEKALEVSNQDPAAFMERDPLSVIQYHTASVILGDPGAGKTTLLKYLVSQILAIPLEEFLPEKAEKVLPLLPVLPIFVSLHGFAVQLDVSEPRKADLLGFICNQIDQDMPFFLSRFMELGAVLLLLDGLDEAFLKSSSPIDAENENGSQECYQLVVECINNLAAKYPRLRIVVTARKSTYFQRSPRLERNGKAFTEIEVLPFRPEDIRHFASKWWQFQPPSLYNVADFKKQLDQNPDIRELAGNPLFLESMIRAYQNGYSLSRDRAVLLASCVKSFPIWDASRGIDRGSPFKIEQSDKRNIYDLLAFVAYSFHKEHKEFFEKSELLEFVEKAIKLLPLEWYDRPEGLLDLMATEGGLIKRNEMGYYQFFSLQFQEYFVAKYLADLGLRKCFGQEELIDLSKYLNNTWWSEIILLYSAYAQDAEKFLELLFEQHEKREDVFLTPLIVAGHCLAACMAREEHLDGLGTSGIGRKIVDALLGELQVTPYTLTRNQTAEALVDIAAHGQGENYLVETLKELLPSLSQDTLIEEDSPVWRICQSLALAVGNIGKVELADRLFEILFRYQEILFRYQEPLLVPEQDHVFHSEVASDIVKSLGKLDEERIVKDMLEKLVAADPAITSNMRSYIAMGLGHTREKSVAGELLSILQNPSFSRESLVGQRILDDQNLIVIVDALARLSESSQSHDLCELLSEAALNVQVRCQIADVLANLDDATTDAAITDKKPQPLDKKLLNLLKNSKIDTSLRCCIATTLGKIGQYNYSLLICAPLQHYYRNELLQANDPSLYQFIATALARLGDTSVISSLLEWLAQCTVDHDAYSLRNSRELPVESNLGVAIAAALGSVKAGHGDINITQALLQTLENEDVDLKVRIATLQALGEQEWESSREWHERCDRLFSLLKDHRQELALRKQAARTLGDLSAFFLLSDLLTLLQKRRREETIDESIIDAAIKLIERDGNERRLLQSAEQLIRILNSQEQNSALGDKAYQALWSLNKRLPAYQVIQDKHTKCFELVFTKEDSSARWDIGA